jgi:hypothetical protein
MEESRYESKAPLLLWSTREKGNSKEINYSEKNSPVEHLCRNIPEIGDLTTYKLLIINNLTPGGERVIRTLDRGFASH